MMYQKALEFIIKKHRGQIRRNGDPYVIHPIRVSQEVTGDYLKTIALLHDVLEDTDTTMEELEDVFGQDMAFVVWCITHGKKESYEDYIARVKINEKTKAVKIADIVDNLMDNPNEKQIKKYVKALNYLIN
ncbi:MAG: HD domain-containing protein [Candidatus Paceibacterota bacterium]